MTDAEHIQLLEESVTNLTKTCFMQKDYIEKQEAKIEELQCSIDKLISRTRIRLIA